MSPTTATLPPDPFDFDRVYGHYLKSGAMSGVDLVTRERTRIAEWSHLVR